MKSLVTLLLASVLSLHAEPGFYTLGDISGNGTREWNISGMLDNHGKGHGFPVDVVSNLFLSDTLVEPGEIVLKEDGTLSAKWTHKIVLTYNYQPNFYQPPHVWNAPDGFNDPEETARFDFDEQLFWNLQDGAWYSSAHNPNPVNKLVATLETEATGTWSGTGIVNLTFDCLVDSTNEITYLPPKSTETVTEVVPGFDLPVSFSTTGTCTPGSISFSWDTLEVWLPALQEAYYTGQKEVVVEDALREEPIGLEGSNSDDYIDREVKQWVDPETLVQGTPLGGELQAKYIQYYLLDVDAPFGFYVLGDYGEAPGVQEARFVYGGQKITRSLESGYAEDGQLSYGDPPDFVEAEILSDGVITETLEIPLTKVPVSPWAGGPGDFTASPGVIYTRAPLDWPISLAATDTISDISFLTGLWGITGSAASEFDVVVNSIGAPMGGALTTSINFTTPKRSESLTLIGNHQTSLDVDGLTASGEFSTSPVSANLTQHVSLFDVIPGAGAALGKFGRILTGGVGLTIEGELIGQAAGTYAAFPSDPSPKFTSGTLTANADLKATLNTVPRFARGVINLAISGGGGVVVVIELAPSPSVSDLYGYANFSLTIKFFDLVDEEFDTEVGERPTFPLPSPAPPAPGPPQNGPTLVANQVPAQGDLDLVHTAQDAYIVHSGAHSSLPAPASEITFQKFSQTMGQWEPTLIPDGSGTSNFAPTIVPATGNTNLGGFGPNLNSGLIVWSKADGTVPTSSADYAAYMNSTDLMFRYFTDSYFFDIETNERTLTDNALADFGPELILATGDEQARLFWVRGDGLDLTGHTTPLQILTRNWIAYDPGAPAADSSTAFSSETVALSGLANILDWRAAAWDDQNAAIACVVDTDGDSATDTDREIHLVRQTAGTWAAPVRVTDNALVDDCPVLLFEAADRLVLSWRQDGQVVGTMNYDVSSSPSPWFGAGSRAPLTWHLARLCYRSSEDSLVALWPEDTGLSYTEEVLGTPVPGFAFPAPRHHELGGIVSNFEASFPSSSDEGLQVVAITENATAADVNTVPTTMPASIRNLSLLLGPGARELSLVDASASDSAPAMGDSVALEVEVSSLDPVSYSWFFNGQLLEGEEASSLTLPPLGIGDDGFYTVRASDGSDTVSHTFTLNSSEPFADWMARRRPSEAVLNGEDDDPDGDGCPNKLEYLFDTDPGDSADKPETVARLKPRKATLALDFHLNAKAVDCPYVIEYSDDLSAWHDATSLFTPVHTIPGVARLNFEAPTAPDAGNAWVLYNIGAEPSTTGYYRLRLE